MKPNPVLTLKDLTIPVGTSVLLADSSGLRARARGIKLSWEKAVKAPGKGLRGRDPKRFDQAHCTGETSGRAAHRTLRVEKPAPSRAEEARACFRYAGTPVLRAP